MPSSSAYAMLAVAAAAVAAMAWRRKRQHFVAVSELSCACPRESEYAVDTAPVIDITGGGSGFSKDPFMASSRPTPLVPKNLAAASRGLRLIPVRGERVTARARAMKLAGARLTPQSHCHSGLADTDSSFAADSVWDSDILCDYGRSTPTAETDKLSARAVRTPPILRSGLGSSSQDFRFQPGAQALLPGGGDMGPAPNTHAGGITFGALAPDTWLPTGAWNATYIKGLGGVFGSDAHVAAVAPAYDAIIAESS